jgi:hypothetical protein
MSANRREFLLGVSAAVVAAATAPAAVLEARPVLIPTFWAKPFDDVIVRVIRPIRYVTTFDQIDGKWFFDEVDEGDENDGQTDRVC